MALRNLKISVSNSFSPMSYTSGVVLYGKYFLRNISKLGIKCTHLFLEFSLKERDTFVLWFKTKFTDVSDVYIFEKKYNKIKICSVKHKKRLDNKSVQFVLLLLYITDILWHDNMCIFHKITIFWLIWSIKMYIQL